MSFKRIETFKSTNSEDLSHYYLKKHRIRELLDNLTGQLVYKRPDNPKTFMIEYFGKLKKSQAAKSNYPCLFDDENIKSLFEIMDPAGRGFINHSQYISGMANLGVVNYERNPPGSDDDQIGIKVFLAQAKEGLETSCATFAT